MFPEASCETTAQMPVPTKAGGRNTKLRVRRESSAAPLLEVVQWKFKTV